MDDIPLRPTGPMERWNILRNHVKMYNNVQVTATYMAPRSLLKAAGSIHNLVYAALNEVIAKNPIMGVTITDEGTSQPKWVRLPTIDLEEVVKVVDEDPNANLDSLVQASHRAQFDHLGDLPVWRVLIISSSTPLTTEDFFFAVGFFAHHAIADGLSCAAFHLTFLEALNTISTSNSIRIPATRIIIVPIQPLEPTLEESTTFPLSIFFTLKKVVRAFIYNPIDALEWSGPTINPSVPRPPKCNTRSFSLSSLIVLNLVSQCRKENTTLTALITVLVARKLAAMYPSQSHFTGAVPFSLRKFTGHSPRSMGVLLSATLTHFASEPKTPKGYISCRQSSSAPFVDAELWASARACKASISAQSASSNDQAVGLIKFVQNDFIGYFLGMLGKKRDHAFEVTNVGVLDGGEKKEGMASFERVMFSQGHCTYGPPHIFCLASAKGGWMTATTSWETGVIEDGLAEGMLGWLEGVLSALGTAAN